MPDAVEFTLADGTSVVVAVPDSRAGSGTVGLAERLEGAQKTLRQALAPVSAAAGEMLDGFRRLPQRPDEVEIAFGVTLDGKLGGVIAAANAGAHLEVTLRWSASNQSRVPQSEPVAPAAAATGRDAAQPGGRSPGGAAFPTA